MESSVEQSCPICGNENSLKMMAHSSEIPYFGEHTQITMSCKVAAGELLISYLQRGRKQVHGH